MTMDLSHVANLYEPKSRAFAFSDASSAFKAAISFELFDEPPVFTCEEYDKVCSTRVYGIFTVPLSEASGTVPAC